MAAWIPEEVRKAIGSHFKSASKEAEGGYKGAKADEDAVTGAFGEALRTKKQQGKVIVNGDEWTFKVTSTKFRGRGKNATEKEIGADGIVEIEVTSNKNDTTTKSLIFQAKKRGNNKGLLGQAEQMEGIAKKGSAVFEFDDEGYIACDAADLLGESNEKGRGS